MYFCLVTLEIVWSFQLKGKVSQLWVIDNPCQRRQTDVTLSNFCMAVFVAATRI